MLPRLRFVVAAVLIAVLPMLFLSSGFVTTARDTYVAEYPRPDAIRPASGDTQNAHQMVLAYARRSTELTRLRDLASEPLDALVKATAADAGALRDSPAMPAAVLTLNPVPSPAPAPPEPDTVASLPPSEPDPEPVTPLPLAEDTAPMAVPETARDEPPVEPSATAQPRAAVPTPKSRPRAAPIPVDPAAPAPPENVEPTPDASANAQSAVPTPKPRPQAAPTSIESPAPDGMGLADAPSEAPAITRQVPRPKPRPQAAPAPHQPAAPSSEPAPLHTGTLAPQPELALIAETQVAIPTPKPRPHAAVLRPRPRFAGRPARRDAAAQVPANAPFGNLFDLR